MSDPVTNIQMEDVLSSIRRLVSEEIGQSGLKPLERKKPAEDAALVLSPAQKIRQEAAEQGDDLWDETAELAPKAPAPLWWHRDFTGGNEQSDDVETTEATEPSEMDAAAEPEQVTPFDVAPDPEPEPTEPPFAAKSKSVANDDPLPEFKSRLSGAIADLEAAMVQDDEEWESEEGDRIEGAGLEFDEMPWSGSVDVDDIVIDEFLERERQSDLPEETFQPEPAKTDAATAADMPDDMASGASPFAEVADILDDMSFDGPDQNIEEIEPEVLAANEEVSADPDDIPFSFRPGERLFERLSGHAPSKPEQPQSENVDESMAPLNAEPEPEILGVEDIYEQDDPGLELDENMLRQMVHDIVRQELQGVLGERITRNVRKLVRREIQRAFSDLGQ